MVAAAGPALTVLGVPVRWRAVPDGLAGGRDLPRVAHGRAIATEDQVWYEDERTRMLVRGTDEIWLEPRPGHERAEVGHYAYGFAAALLLLHAGRFAMHASTVRTASGHTVVIAGDSGAGKSTTCMAVAARGGSVLVDDVSPLRPTGAGVVVEPFSRPVHLLDDAVDRLGLNDARRVAVAEAVGPGGKAVLAVEARDAPAAASVDRLVVLVAREGVGSEPVLRPVVGAERLRLVVRHSNVTGLASFGSRAEAYFAWAVAVADGLDTVEISRDPDTDSLDAVVGSLAGVPAPD